MAGDGEMGDCDLSVNPNAIASSQAKHTVVRGPIGTGRSLVTGFYNIETPEYQLLFAVFLNKMRILRPFTAHIYSK